MVALLCYSKPLLQTRHRTTSGCGGPVEEESRFVTAQQSEQTKPVVEENPRGRRRHAEVDHKVENRKGKVQ